MTSNSRLDEIERMRQSDEITDDQRGTDWARKGNEREEEQKDR